MDHQALPAVDIPILAEPDQFVGQLLDELGGVKAPKLKLRAEMKSLSHWNDTKFAKFSTKGEMTMWDMAMTDP